MCLCFFFLQAEDGIRDLVRSRGLGDVYKRQILVYAKSAEKWRRNDLPRTAKQDDAYKNPDNDHRGPWKATPIQARNYYSKGLYSVSYTHLKLPPRDLV